MCIMAAGNQSLRDRQVGEPQREIIHEILRFAKILEAIIKKILNLNKFIPQTTDTAHEEAHANGLLHHATPILGADEEPIWKVLVFDNLGRDVISSVLRVNDLRSWGITIHLYVLLSYIRLTA